MGCQFAASALVGQKLGEKNPAQAKRFALLCVVFAVSIICISSVFVIILKDDLGFIFNKDPATVDMISSLMPHLAIFTLLDAIHGVQQGTVRALGRQKIVTYVTILSYYGFGIPFAIYLGFYQEMELQGFWISFIITMGVTDLINIYIVVTAPWKAEHNLDPVSEEAR